MLDKGYHLYIPDFSLGHTASIGRSPARPVGFGCILQSECFHLNGLIKEPRFPD